MGHKRSPESLFPIPRVYDFCRNRNLALLGEASNPPREVLGIYLRLIKGEPIRHDVHVDKPQAKMEAFYEAGRVVKGCTSLTG